jgi:hypothetical protein
MNGTEVPLPGRASNRREPIPARRSIDGDDLDEGGQKMSAQGTVAVGVDGSDCSRTALEFAFDEAVRRGAAVRVVSAVPEAEYWATEYGMSPSLLAELSASVEKVAQDMVDEVVRERGGSAAEVPVEIRTVGGCRPMCSCRRPATRTCSSSGTVGGAGSAAPCSARSVCSASCMLRSRWRWSAPHCIRHR